MSEKFNRKNINLHLKAQVMPTSVNTLYCLKITTKPKANLLSRIPPYFAVSLSASLNTTFASTTNSNQ